MPSTVKIKPQSIGLAFCARLAIIIVSSNLQLSRCSQNVLRVNSSTTPIAKGRPYAITCRVLNSSSPEVWWSKGGVNLTTSGKGQVTLEFKELSLSDISDEYTCNTILSSGETFNITHLILFDVPPEMTTSGSKNVELGQTVSVTCNVTGYPLKETIHWTFVHKVLSNSSQVIIFPGSSSLTHRFSSLKINNVTDENNGTYFCRLGNRLKKQVDLKVLSKPVVRLDVIRAVGESNIFLNWTLKDGNSPLTDLILSYKEWNKSEDSKVVVEPSTTRYILKNLSALTQYTDFEIRGTNSIGVGEDRRQDIVTTLAEDPNFVPSVSVKGVSTVSVTLGWDSPNNVTEFYHYYNVTARSLDGQIFSSTAYENPYLVTNLQPGKNYTFQVQACSSFTQSCDGVSSEKNAETMDGRSSVPQNIKVECLFGDKSRDYSVQVTWDAPSEPRGEIKDYQVTLNGEAEYVDGFGAFRKETVSQSQKTVLANQNNETFNGLAPNTNFTVSICAKTRTRQCGDVGTGTCSTPVTTPGVEELSKANWSSVRSKVHPNQVYFMVSLPSISQRNGTICCFRVIVVRLQKRQTVNSLPSPNQMDKDLRSYDEIHNGSDTGGAYVAEMLNSSSFQHITSQSQKSIKIIIGDEEYAKDDKRSICHKCWPSSEATPGSTGSYRKSHNYPDSTADIRKHRKRHANSSSQLYPEGPTVKDGPLDSESIYTAYLDAIILLNDKKQIKAHSPYFAALQPKLVYQKENNSGAIFNTVGMLIIGGLIVVLIVAFMALMCVMRWRRKEPGDQEYNGLSHSIQQLCRRFRGQQLIPHITPDQPPIPKDQLVSAYQERHENADIVFQKEFEDLPDRFRDRTTDASEKNSSKNRYPDIKAYDQTRVKLSTADGGSDYINANIVVGYKERKKFICAQGPMESTVVDWWRMIWEQRVHLLLMLTNIEEYSKTKCAKYWPSEGSNEYGNITVTHTSEKRYSDYLVRNLKLRLNGPDGDTVKEEREVEQYHYLVWKDYMAPEHPVGIIRFIKRFNEVYSLEKGPILVHCSAGVGRTGTLVALDSLLQQLNEESCVSIFNTICDLRHQRNYLVQSLKQYIFIYRALMEAALFGDTEVPVSELKTHIEKLKSIPDGRTVSRIHEEFEKLSQVVEDRKPFSAGSSDENRHRNRHENVIPYDRNRVILSPMPGLNKEICTYINASFIEGYDSSEQYIIAQDPLEITVGDFWRMIVEHNVRSVVMLSEVGEDKCPRYWPEKDQETSHDYIRVKYMQSQSFPFYYRREFTVTNTKAEDSCLVTQFQYNGWPVGEMAVPESTRGIVELIDTTFKHRETLDKTHGSTLIHCSAGSDRSCIFVALAILVRQMMTESRVDVFSVVRKLRSQRQGLFQNLAQYEFIYRGLDIYADLHVANGNASH